MTKTIQILLISGSVRLPSYTRTLTEFVRDELMKRDVVATHWNLGTAPLPIAKPAFHHNPIEHPNKKVRSFVSLAISCDAFVLASPIYHNSYSGVLKNALDHLAIPQFYYKPIGLISHGGNRSTQAVDHLRIVARGLQAVATPTQVCTSPLDYQNKDEHYELVAADIISRAERFVSELIVFGHQFRHFRQSLVVED